MASTEQKPKITLYWLEKSRSQRILWLLEELNLEYELKTYKRGSDKLAPPELQEIHPLGTSPAVTIEVPGAAKPIVLVESAQIVEYMTDYYGKHLVPERYPAGKDGQIGAETEEWLRYRHYSHYAEASIMPLLLMTVIVNGIKNAPVPFFIKPITSRIGAQVETAFLNKKFQTHFDFLEDQLKTAPEGGPWLCGSKLTGADIMMSFPMDAANSRSGFLSKERYPKLKAYIDTLHASESFQRALTKIEKATGEKYVAVG